MERQASSCEARRRRGRRTVYTLQQTIVAFPTRIYLTGFMGSGKSTIGPLVAEVLDYRFLDLDAIIEVRAGQPIRTIFAEEGEAAFRAREAEALATTTRQEAVVVALGGGALASEANLKQARMHGVIVYLHVAPDVLAERLREGQAERPLLCDEAGRPLSPAALRSKIEAMLAVREAFYRRAHITIDATHQQIGQTAAAVMAAVRAFREEPPS